jgi:hypothetical protein
MIKNYERMKTYTGAPFMFIKARYDVGDLKVNNVKLLSLKVVLLEC